MKQANYKIVKVCNNNVVLAEDGTKQVLLISKGIGFAKKNGDIIYDNGNYEKVYHIFNSSSKMTDIRHLNYDVEIVRNVTHDIVEYARRTLEINNDGLFDALYDHISFAVGRLKVGLPIENPFIGEIMVLCRNEYDVAEYASQLIKKSMDVDIGDAEKGFIALHLYSAKKNKPVHSAIKSVRIYREVMEMIMSRYGIKINERASLTKSFLLTLNRYIYLEGNGRKIDMPFKNHVRTTCSKAYTLSKEIASLIKNELEVAFTEDTVAYLALDIQKLSQL